MHCRLTYRRGVVSVWVALMGLALIGMLGLACDAAYVVYTNMQLQNTADAAALAGAIYVQARPDPGAKRGRRHRPAQQGRRRPGATGPQRLQQFRRQHRPGHLQHADPAVHAHAQRTKRRDGHRAAGELVGQRRAEPGVRADLRSAVGQRACGRRWPSSAAAAAATTA